MPESPAATTQNHAKIGPTAHVTAYAWYQLGMPYGHLFATREGAAMYWSFVATAGLAGRLFKLPTLLEFLEFRHRMIEAALERLEPDRVIELGAGLSRRGLTWVLDHGVPYTEIDLPHMTQAKRELLDAAPGRVRRALREGELELRSTDILAPSFADELEQLCAGFARPVVISEGMLDYFTLAARQTLFCNLVAGFRAAGVRGRYLTDLRRADRERKVGPAALVLRSAIKLATGGQGLARPFRDYEHVDRSLALAGFDEREELRPKALAELEPRLARLRSPTSIWLSTVHARST
jgi:O-methyltransferase involved in polyketide biosynthesis